MIIINKDSNSTIVMTLTEKSTLSSPNYLFYLTSDVTRQSKAFIASDLSSFPARFNEFLITETSGTENLTSGTVTLEPEGQWTYAVYEQTSSSNLDPSQADNTTPVEVGMVKVKGTANVVTKYTGTDTTFIVHERE